MLQMIRSAQRAALSNVQDVPLRTLLAFSKDCLRTQQELHSQVMQSIRVLVEPQDTVATLCSNVQDKFAIPVAQQHLSFNGKPLQPTDTVGALGLQEGALVQVCCWHSNVGRSNRTKNSNLGAGKVWTCTLVRVRLSRILFGWQVDIGGPSAGPGAFGTAALAAALPAPPPVLALKRPPITMKAPHCGLHVCWDSRGGRCRRDGKSAGRRTAAMLFTT